MSAQKRLLILLSLCILFVAVTLFPTSASSSQVRVSDQPVNPPGVVIPYAASLTDPNGQAVDDGLYDFKFEVYSEANGGSPLWSETQTGVTVKTGKLSTALGNVSAMPDAVKTNKELWLAVSLRGPGDAGYTALTPRQKLQPNAPASPSALTCPHSHFGDYWTGSNTYYGLDIDNSGTGDGIDAYSRSPYANYAAVYAVNVGSTGYGTGVWGQSYLGVGVYASSNAGDGLEATTQATTTKSAIYAHAVDANGVWAISTNKEAVHGGSTSSYGVHGDSTDNFGGYFTSTNFRGLYASGGANWYAGYFVDPAGSGSAGLYVDGTIVASGSKTGYVTDLAMNDGAESLETGDVVVVTGYGDPILGQIPLVKVRKASKADSKAVVGIVDQPMTANTMSAGGVKDPPVPAAARALKTDNTAIAQGRYLSIVTLGSYKAVKADASARAIQPGDLLVTSANPGYVMVSDNPLPGTIIGKAMSTLNSGTGVIPLMVTLH